jgi:hypothetical protein
MSQKQIRISDEVYEMLEILKPFPTASFNDTLLLMINEIDYSLPKAIDDLKILEQRDPQEAAAKRQWLRKATYEQVTVELLLSQNERQLEDKIDRAAEAAGKVVTFNLDEISNPAKKDICDKKMEKLRQLMDEAKASKK